MKVSARNLFEGKVVSIKQGPIHVEVTLEIAGGQTITAVVTAGSAERLGLKEGTKAYAMIKASSVLLAVD
jgi:molybdopterin-binding protein